MNPKLELETTMADLHDKATRSFNMSRIKGKNTKPEMLVRRFLFARGFRCRLNVKTLPGKPDIVLPKYKTVIFIIDDEADNASINTKRDELAIRLETVSLCVCRHWYCTLGR